MIKEAKFFRKQAQKAELAARATSDEESSQNLANLALAYRRQADALKKGKKKSGIKDGLKVKVEMSSKFRIREATQTDLKREFERRGYTDWQWAMTALVAFAILDYLCLGLKVMK